MRTWLRSLMACFGQHDDLLHFEADRIYLQCQMCGRETNGWNLDEKPPRVIFAAPPKPRIA